MSYKIIKRGITMFLFLKKRKLNKKHEGNVGDIIGSIICVIFMFAILTTSINSNRIMSIKTQVDRMSRKAMLQLETKGILTATEKQDLYDEVMALGFDEVDITVNGGSSTKVVYGFPVTIEIQGRTSGRTLGLYNSWNNSWDKDYNFGVKYESISKASKT